MNGDDGHTFTSARPMKGIQRLRGLRAGRWPRRGIYSKWLFWGAESRQFVAGMATPTIDSPCLRPLRRRG